MDKITLWSGLIILFFTLQSFNYEPQIQEPFAEYQVQQPYYQSPQPNKAPIDWDNLPYDDATWGWLYKELWYIYHPNSGEIPPWIKQTAIDKNIPWIFILTLILIYIYRKKYNIKFAHIKK